MALEPIRITHPVDPDRAAVEQRVVRAAESDPERFLAAYVRHPESFGGRYVGADLMKETLPEYAASPVSRGRYNNAVHNTAAVLASAQFSRAVGDRSDPMRQGAIFLTGSPGSGKTSLVLANGFEPTTRVMYEGQLVDASAHAKVTAALDAGLYVGVVAILPRIEDAFENTLKRFELVGRGASIATMAKIHDGTPNGIESLHAAFGNRINIQVTDNRDRNNPRTYGIREGLALWQEELSHGSTEQRLNDQLYRIRRDGRGSDDFERQARGRAIEARNPSVDGPGSGDDETLGRKPERPSSDRAPGLLTLARGSTLAGLAAAVPAGRASIPDGAEQIVVMNGSRLHESRHGGEWVVQKSDPQGMLPHGVFRLDTASPAKPDDGARYAGSILHVSAKGIYQAHGNGVARHDPARFEQKPAIGETATITYANGRATLANRGPDLPSKGRSI